MSITTAPNPSELFSDAAPGVERADRFESYKAALDDSALLSKSMQAKGYRFNIDGSEGPEWVGSTADGSTPPRMNKALSTEERTSLEAELAKTISLTSPLSTGLVAYDLEAPAKLLAPRLTPLRNIIPRLPGKGTARRYKRITGISNSGTGGVADMRIGITDTSTATFGSAVLKRGAKISYAADEATVLYVQTGLSDDVLWSADFAGQGFQDIRQLSHTAILAAHMNGEEKYLLGGRGTLSGYAGALSAPTSTNFTVTARTAGVGETGNSANIANWFVYISAESTLGESIASTVITGTSLSAVTGKVLDITATGTGVVGATGYRVYVGGTTGTTNCFYVGRTGFYGGTSGLGTAMFTINFTGAGTGGLPTIANGVVAPAADNSATASEYDGILTYVTGSGSGYVGQVGGKFSTTNPGVEYQAAFVALWNANRADPDAVWMNGADRKQLSDTFKIGGSGNPSFLYTVGTNPADMTVGSVVSGVLNEVTGKTVGLNVHPYMPQGNSAVLSYGVPIPDSNISNCWEWHGPQDYMAIDWPVIQHSYDIGTYQYGALLSYATVLSGFVGGIQAA